VARSCWKARDGRATILANEGVARWCSKAQGGRTIFLAVYTVFLDGEFVGGFGGGLCLVVLWGFFEE